jgi:hypothetical protein
LFGIDGLYTLQGALDLGGFVVCGGIYLYVWTGLAGANALRYLYIRQTRLRAMILGNDREREQASEGGFLVLRAAGYAAFFLDFFLTTVLTLIRGTK